MKKKPKFKVGQVVHWHGWIGKIQFRYYSEVDRCPRYKFIDGHTAAEPQLRPLTAREKG